MLEDIGQSMDYVSMLGRRNKLEKAVRVEKLSSGIEYAPIESYMIQELNYLTGKPTVLA